MTDLDQQFHLNVQVQRDRLIEEEATSDRSSQIDKKEDDRWPRTDRMDGDLEE